MRDRSHVPEQRGTDAGSGYGSQLLAALRLHWPEVLMEGIALGAFLLSASLFATLLFHPERLGQGTGVLCDEWIRRLGMGAAMGLTAIAILHSPFGRRSGGHLNPAVTLAFWRLGRVDGPDAVLYALGQSAGALCGLLVARLFLGDALGHPAVDYVSTRPGLGGPAIAWLAEFAMAATLMTVVLHLGSHPRLSAWTGLAAGTLVALFVVIEAPLSGMSMNPARTIASALWSGHWEGVWIYLTAPPVAMLLAAEADLRLRGGEHVRCAKLLHGAGDRCIFRCRYAEPISVRAVSFEDPAHGHL